jgi:hypothetical protein
MLRWLGWGICFRLRASLVVENICLCQQRSSAAKLTAIPAGESPANRGVQLLL